ncbi:MAG: M10 family metallopeptidase C-terminal domain-containing protein [Hyphomonadaceae bacterium]
MPLPTAFLSVPDTREIDFSEVGPWRGASALGRLGPAWPSFDDGAARFTHDSDAALRCGCPACGGTAPTDPQSFIDPQSGVAGNGLPIYNWDQAAAQLTRDSNGWPGFAGATVSYAFRSTMTGALPNGVTGFTRFTEAQIIATEVALQLWSDVANITFVRAGSGTSGDGAYSNFATMLFSNYSSGADGASAFAFFPGSTANTASAGDVWVNISLASNQDLSAGSFGPHTLSHEIGHAIGLSHPADYDALDPVDPTYPDASVYWQDSRAYTVMSYFGSAGVNHSLNAFAAGPQLHDIAAAQLLYGANLTTRTGNTVYGFNSNTGLAHYTITADGQSPVFAIWDAGGTDTIDFSGYSTSVEIDLREEAFSSAGPGNSGIGVAVGNISIARGAVIENGVGGANADTLTGNAVANALSGLAGNDVIVGLAGNDVIDGGAGNDTMTGGVGDDAYVVDSAGDVVTELADEGTDTVTALRTYVLGANLEILILGGAETLRGTGNALGNVITGNAASNRLTGLAGADVLNGAAGNDVLSGGDGDDTLNGGDGRDTLDGGAGADAMSGGADNDFYVVDNAGDTVSDSSGVDLVTASVNYTIGAGIENLTLVGAAVIGVGNAGNNLITGNALANTLSAGAGRDRIFAGAGNDTLNGDAGNDNLYGEAGDDLIDGGLDNDAMFGGAGNDTYIVVSAGDRAFENANEGIDLVRASRTFTLGDNVENLLLEGAAGYAGTGNALDNTITGNVANNRLFGLAGDDVILGGDGNDVITGGLGDDVLTGGAGRDRFVLEPGFGDDVVTDFDADSSGGQDLIDVAALGITTATFAARVTITDLGAHTLITIDGVDTIRLDNVSGVGANAVTISDFFFGP